MSGRSDSWLAQAGRDVRGLWPDHNPLRRTYDRIEAGIVAALLALFLIGAPLAAVFAGRLAYDAGLRAERAQQAKWHQVVAVLVEDAVGAEYGATALVQWTTPDGVVHAGVAPVPLGSPAGSSVRIWVDASGQASGPPMRSSDVAGNVVVAVVATVAGAGLLLFGAGALAHRILGRKRLTAWEADWRATGPQWTHHW
jgi:hypothetical protein